MANLQVLGMTSERFPPKQKCTINCHLLGLSVVALLENETEASIDNMYSPAFGMNTAQEFVRKITGAVQSDEFNSTDIGKAIDTEKSLVSSLNTQQIYEGSEPPVVELPLVLVAMEDPKREVEDAIDALREMSLPALTVSTIGSRPPPRVTINLARQILLTHGRVESLAVNDFGTYSTQGTLWSRINLRIKAMQMPSRKNSTAEEKVGETSLLQDLDRFFTVKSETSP